MYTNVQEAGSNGYLIIFLALITVIPAVLLWILYLKDKLKAKNGY